MPPKTTNATTNRQATRANDAPLRAPMVPAINPLLQIGTNTIGRTAAPTRPAVHGPRHSRDTPARFFGGSTHRASATVPPRDNRAVPPFPQRSRLQGSSLRAASLDELDLAVRRLRRRRRCEAFREVLSLASRHRRSRR